MLNTVGLYVYRSVAVRDTDPMYKPVLDLLERQRFQVIRHRFFDDPKMMFGEAEWTVSLAPAPAWLKIDLNRLDPLFVEEMCAEGDRILGDLIGVA